MKTVTENTIKGFVGCLKSISDVYQSKGIQKYHTYNHAISSINELGYNEFAKRMKKNEKIPYIGKATIDKYNEYLKTGTMSKLKELGIVKMEKTKNPHKHEMKRSDAEKLVKPFFNYLKKNLCEDITYVGSYRRGKEKVGDMDMLLVGNKLSFFDCFKNKKGDKVKINKNTSIEISAIGDKKMKVILKNSDTKKVIEIDLRIFKNNEKATALLYFTGSQNENIRLRSVAKRNGLKLSEYGITTLKDNKLHHFKTEEAVYKYLGCTYKEPEER